ncbi:hypothetical protein RIF29_20691 [Crotalaria pallida]|uniref:Uncharacterized protein n=1 Tax=Crotalaria pallida TaxID=3830 RepID=A0AAN9F3G2_CROPI
MAQVLQSPSHFPSPSSSSSTPCGPHHNSPTTLEQEQQEVEVEVEEEEEEEEGERKKKEREREGDQLSSILTLLVVAFRKSLIGSCSSPSSNRTSDAAELSSSSMEIGLPSNVRHVAHVTFDRFNGFLGLPVEFEPHVPIRVPSASANVFGVSVETMQLSFDARGNSVPTILLLMQRHLYAQGGLQAEGIFRINAENSQEEFVREQLNRGVVPDGIDVHCLAGLIKAWFRELPTGVLDPLSPEQVMQSESEEECAQLVSLLPHTEATLLDWAINLMADVAQLEHLNKMNARNVAMVFAPNMTKMEDPLTALMYAVQVMNFLKTLVMKTLREREESIVKSNPTSNLNSFDNDGHQSSSWPIRKGDVESGSDSSEEDTVFVEEEPSLQSPGHLMEDSSETESGSNSLPTSEENIAPKANRSLVDVCPCNVVSQVCSLTNGVQDYSSTTGQTKVIQANICKSRSLCSSNYNMVKYALPVVGPLDKNKGTSIIELINSRTELAEAWR